MRSLLILLCGIALMQLAACQDTDAGEGEDPLPPTRPPADAPDPPSPNADIEGDNECIDYDDEASVECPERDEESSESQASQDGSGSRNSDDMSMSMEDDDNGLQCDVDASERIECGFSGINRTQCEERGCCYEDSMRPEDARFCFYEITDCCRNSGEKLTVCGTQLCINGSQTFLSGVNYAYTSHGFDFGNDHYVRHAQEEYERNLTRLKENGGNAIRFFLHGVAEQTPMFDENGFVVATDGGNTLIRELEMFLDFACANGVLVFPTLWNGSPFRTETQMQGVLRDPAKLQSYIDNALIPIVKALGGHRGLGGWDIINEPEGAIMGDFPHEDRCLRTADILTEENRLMASWSPPLEPPEHILRFLNWQADAIHRHSCDLVTVGAWKVEMQTDAFADADPPGEDPGKFNNPSATRNYYSDECLQAPSCSRELGYLDFYSSHTYAEGDQYTYLSPMRRHASVYEHDKPHVIGEFSEEGGDGRSSEQLFEHSFRFGYSGGWSWQANGHDADADDFETQLRGIRHIKGMEEGRISAIGDSFDCSEKGP